MRRLWSLGWRLGLTVLLLGWAFHAIFHDQIRRRLQAEGISLDALPRLERWGWVWRLGPVELGQTLLAVQPGWLAVSTLLWGATIALGAWRWGVVLRSQGLDLGFRKTLRISLIAHFFNSFLLGSTGGDLLKAYYAARVTHHRKTEAVTSVVIDRVLGLFGMLAFSVVFLGINARFVMNHSQTVILAVVILGMFAGAGGVLWMSLRGGVSQVLPRAREWLRRLPKAEVLERALDSCRAVGRDRRMLSQSLGISVLLTVVCVFQLLTLIWGYGLTVEWSPVFLVVPAVICISALPVTPNGLGVRDNLYLYLLSLPEIGISAGTAVAVSLVAYAASLVWSAVGGVLYVFRRHEAELIDAVAEETEEDSGEEAWVSDTEAPKG